MKRISYIIFIISIILSLWTCGKKNDQSKETVTETIDNRIQVTEAQFEQSNMTLGSLEEKLFPTVINVNGMIDVPPENRAVVSAQVGGYIKKLPLLIGDKVYKGQVLITIENPEFVVMQQEYLEVKEQLTYLKAEYDRQQTMQAENITSQKSFLKAESAYKMAIAKQTGLAKQLRMLNISPANVKAGNLASITTIYAPISGSITKVNVTKGSYVSPATAILEIVDNDHIHVELSVFEKDIMNVKKGQKISFKIPEASLGIYKAQVHLVGTAIENNRTIKVHAHLDDESHNNFLTGMFVEASIITDSTLAKALPSEALVTVDDVSTALILDKKEEDIYYFKQQEVNVIATYDGYSRIENTDIFESNVQFLTKGAFNLIGE